MPELDTSTQGDGIRRVCVVDDDADIRDSLRFLLEEAGYQVEEAEDGTGALRFLESTDSAWIVLLDRMMPRMDGVAVLRALADMPQVTRRTAIVFLTARADPPDPESMRTIASQTIAAISKPFNLDTLLAAVERASQLLADRSVS